LGTNLVLADEFFRKVWFHVRSMAKLEPARVPAYFLERFKAVWRTLTSRTSMARAVTEFASPIRSRGSPNMYLVGRRYRPKSYDGRVVLFRRSLRAVSKYLDWKLGWAGVIVGKLEVVEIQGGHGDIIDGPQVKCTADKLSECLGDSAAGIPHLASVGSPRPLEAGLLRRPLTSQRSQSRPAL
jgi:thioesterase domain-containing protein